MNFDQVIDSYRTDAERLMQSGQVEDVEFSRGTYQVQVVTDNEEVWPFVQFDEAGKLADAFCSCDQADENGGCVHLAAAILRLYSGHKEPLHIRYAASLWNQLGRLFGRRQGYDSKILHRISSNRWVLNSKTGKQLFSVEGQNDVTARLEALIDRRVPETEETSLKFSGLSYEEIALWREGRPSEQLRYELSFWSDLAKWMMILQDSACNKEILFEYAPSGLPNELIAAYGDLKISFYLSAANLPLIIPALSTVKAPLKVYSYTSEAIEKVIYHKAKGELEIVERENEQIRVGLALEEAHQKSDSDHLVIGDWLFFPGDGFYSKEQHAILKSPIIPHDQISQALNEHAQTIANHLVGEKIHSASIAPQYEISFDSDWNLHVSTYLFSPRDMHEGQSRYFGNWAYLDDVGFYPLKDVLFDQLETVVPPSEVADFVHRNRVWLNEQRGYHTHLTTVESWLTYSFDDDNVLRFSSRVDLPTGLDKSHDFGDWVYVDGQGFYSKSGGRSRGAVVPGKEIPLDEVSLFIQMHKDELELVQGFFSEVTPVVAGSLSLKLSGKSHVKVIPGYELFPEYTKRRVLFLDEYVYVSDEGFCKIPKRLLLPERFREPITLKGKELELFLTYELATLQPYISSIDPKLKKATSLKIVVRNASQEAKRRHGHLLLTLEYQSQSGNVSLADVYKGLGKRDRYLFTDAGLFDLKDTRFSWLQQINPARLEKNQNVVQMTTLEFIRLNAVERLEYAPESASAKELLDAFASLSPAQRPVLEGLQSQLRPYQEVGVNWLWFLYSHHLSGLLCDDMGLGKTHQAMALLAAVNNEFLAHPEEERPHYLVVCPTSVIYHWRDKLAQYLPDARVYTHYGAARSLANLSDCDILITSYGTLRSEKERLANVHFEVAIYDEIQVAKNASSQTHKAVSAMKARMRIGLTGTPIENDLRELKALFNVVLPTYLPSDTQFRESFIIPIEKEGDPHRKDLLKRVIKPFVMRRKKEEVLTELPEKTEERAHCDLLPQQAKLYNEVLEQSRQKLLAELQDEGKKVDYIHIFALLTALKRICDHPAVYLKCPNQYTKYESGKWELFCELISQAQESNQKVVVFSQYLDMLDIIELYLKDQRIAYASIRGSTARRDLEIKRFQTDPKCRLFVGSLNAAGVGIELTAASIVIHYDRWWTQAREDQATDRVHRIGQTRGVQVFKLLTVGTLEERIDKIIARKGQLLEEIIGSDEKGQLKAFTRQELQQLLSLL